MWEIDVCRELTLTYVRNNLSPAFASGAGRLSSRILAFLDRWGYVNFGVFDAAPSADEQSTGVY